VIRNGIRDAEPSPHRRLSSTGRRDRFSFFGHLNPYKGALVAIEAAKRLAQQTDNQISLTLHGSSDFQTDDFKAELAKASEGAPFIVAHGRYARDELPQLMADADWVIVPSIWWENAPLIIQEAFQHRRPVICSGIGGMAEAVRDGVDGLWFNAGDSRQLADKMAEALDPNCWAHLVAGINAPRKMSEAADDHLALYKELAAANRNAPSLSLAADTEAVRVIDRMESKRPAKVETPIVAVSIPAQPDIVRVHSIAAPTVERAMTMACSDPEEAAPEIPMVVQLEDAAPQAAPEPETGTTNASVAVLRAAESPALQESTIIHIREAEPPAREAVPAAPVTPAAAPAVAEPLSAEKPPPVAPTKTDEVNVMDDGRLIDEVDFRSSYRLRRLLRGGGAA
jgi:hypothetical protein